MNKHLVPVLRVVAGNKYLRSLMEGFYVTLPIIIFSSIIGIIMWVPPAFKGNMAWYPLVARQCLNRIYVFTMGLVSIFFTAGIARALAEKINQGLPTNRKMNLIMVMFAAISAVFMLSVTGTFTLTNDGSQTENFASIFISNLAAQGMLTGIIIGLTIPWIFYLPVKYNWTIKLPKAVPQGISQSFSDIIPYGLAVLVYWGFGYIFIGILNMSFTDALFQAIKPVFSGLDSYGFLAAMAFLTAFIWFIGVHGPSVTRPFITPFMYSNLADNQAIFAQGGHPHWALTYEFSYDFTSTMGGTGATFVIPILLILFAKSKQLKAVGFASYIPIWFQVNEPALFGCPLILNPIVMIPFMILPIINVVIYKFFIETLGMNGAIVDVPWSMPAIVGLLLGTSFQWQAVVLWGILCLVDFICWLPFVLLMDRLTCTEEIKSAQEKGIPKPMHFNYFTLARLRLGSKLDLNKEKRLLFTNQLAEFTTEIKTERANNKAAKIEAKKALIAQNQQLKAEKLAAKKAGVKFNKNRVVAQDQPVSQPLTTQEQYHVLIVCYGAGTSAMFAASANKGAANRGIKNIVIDSAAYGSHRNLMKEMDLVVLSPQVNVYIDEIERDASAWNVKIVETKGKQYIDCTNNPDQAIDLILANLPGYHLEAN
ncbi:PTS transporter subunit EIIC [Spiroplasma sp. DGKH1]|uniref:PTS transporter subunit EIIC n=1 Tax=Spiroplasma sp. DGKH1 TaxID=3050074 RepID=UPI0034C67664